MSPELDDDDWYDDIRDSPEEQRRDKIRALMWEVLEAYRVSERPIRIRNLTVDFEARTVSVDGRAYGPIEHRAFTIPLLDSTHAIMPSRTNEPW